MPQKVRFESGRNLSTIRRGEFRNQFLPRSLSEAAKSPFCYISCAPRSMRRRFACIPRIRIYQSVIKRDDFATVERDTFGTQVQAVRCNHHIITY
jgi:hypothetical protein